MDGLLLIDKPAGLTSHRVVEIIRRKFGLRKVGHAGTLDPLATGLLVIMLGRATKLSNSLTSQFKTYQVGMKLFLATDSGDITGQIIKREPERVFTEPQIQTVFNIFNNNYAYQQTPPLYSAIKIKGKKGYEYARQGLNIAMPPRPVIIKSSQVLSYQKSDQTINFMVECSKGTYVRSLVGDIAQQLGTVATVSQLRRLSSGSFSVNQAHQLEEVSLDKIISISNMKLFN